MGKLTVREVRKHLETKSHADLINDIVMFFSTFDGVKEYYSVHMGLGYNQDLLDKYKKIIRNEFFPARGFGTARLSIARKAINDYKKVSNNLAGLVDLMLFYVEMGVQYTKSYGDINTFAKTLIRETTPFGLLESCLLWNIGQFVRTDTGDYSFRVTRTEPFPQVSN